MKKNYTNIICFCLLMVAALPIISGGLMSNAFASSVTADNNAFSRVLCNILDIATGSGGKAFAAFAIISVGIGFFTGKVSWGLMIGVAAGIAAIFGAPSIVAAVSGGTAVDCKNDVTFELE